MHTPAEKGDLEKVRLLLQDGADINEANIYGLTPIYKAFCSENEELIMYLLEQGADIWYNSSSDNFPDCYNYVLRGNNLKWIKYFLDKGIDPNICNKEGSNALVILLSSSVYDLKTIKLLLDAGCNPQLKNNFGYSAVDYATGSGITEVVDLFKSYDVKISEESLSPDIRGMHGPEKLFEIIETGKVELLKEYLKQNPDTPLNKWSGKNQLTPLTSAIIGKKVKIIHFLLDSGSDPSLRDNMGYLPLELVNEWVIRDVPGFKEIQERLSPKKKRFKIFGKKK